MGCMGSWPSSIYGRLLTATKREGYRIVISNEKLDDLMEKLRQSTKRNSLDFVVLYGTTLYKALDVKVLNAYDYAENDALKSAAKRAELFIYQILDSKGRDDVIAVMFSTKEFSLDAQTIYGTMEDRIEILKRDFELIGAIVEANIPSQ